MDIDLDPFISWRTILKRTLGDVNKLLECLFANKLLLPHPFSQIMNSAKFAHAFKISGNSPKGSETDERHLSFVGDVFTCKSGKRQKVRLLIPNVQQTVLHPTSREEKCGILPAHHTDRRLPSSHLNNCLSERDARNPVLLIWEGSIRHVKLPSTSGVWVKSRGDSPDPSSTETLHWAKMCFRQQKNSVPTSRILRRREQMKMEV